ncbi:MAG: ABC transporter substrate-binding protein [Burkholderiaceae bacterium]|uniref:extracellular solute-binding protein n=1 Tax=Ottowia sp. TaxID=1898956 RepID=UPI002C785884|nr:extracellular solute-binding protein [Ottowia sp.]MCP5257933.1 ABC transporter substrate-binding protein [Burkholderiaceae bacterium]HRW70770.1 extracellular solute-binding protein [Ottowia sp.]
MRLLLACLLLATPAAWAAHGYALWGDLKYPPGFDHFDYVNPAAPKGGEIRMVSGLRNSNFDKYNPFTMKGSAPAYLGDLLFDTLLTGSLDEAGAAYGLLAEDVAVAPDRLSATFRLRPEARFHNGDAVTAQDVKHSFDTLMGPYTSPAYKTLLVDVAGVDVLDARTVRYRFKRPNRELPLTVGGLPVFSRKWGQGKPFDQVVMDEPIGSGPYRIGPVKFGKDIIYVRDPNYWARDLNVKRGTDNFDRVLIKIYKDNTARLEALKAGEFDLMAFYSAGDWARRVNGPRFKSGELVKGEFRHKLPTGFQSYVLNSRRPFLSDVRVREALGLAIDYEWMNRQMFYNAYTRVKGIFGNTDCAATGTPDAAQLALMEPFRAQIPPAAFGPAYEPPRTDRPHDPKVGGLRENLRRAQQLLVQAGWTVQDGELRNAQGQPMVLEYLDSNEGGARVVTPWMRNLDKLGIRLVYRPVDFALYQQRLQKFDFDITTIAYQGTLNPGQEYADLFGSKAADTEDSGNLAGVKSPAVDSLISHMVGANTRPEFLAACRALERVVSHSHYLLPQWYSPVHRLAYKAWRLQKPDVVPPYFRGETWAMETWWARQPPKAK